MSFLITKVFLNTTTFFVTPQDYKAGPGDEAIINIFGSTESSLTEISRGKY